MEWKVTAFPEHSGIVFWLASTQKVTVGKYSEMEFVIAPTQVDIHDQAKKWKLSLNLRDDREDVVASESYLYGTLTEATTDAEALSVYLRNTTDTASVFPDSVHTPPIKVLVTN